MATTNPRLRSRLCAVDALGATQDPIGACREVDRALFVELLLPWADLLVDDEHGSVANRLRALQRRHVEQRQHADLPVMSSMCAIAPDSEWSEPGRCRVIVARSPEALYAGYAMTEYSFPDDSPDIVALASAVLLEDRPLASFERYRCEPFPGVDFFVCTHGQVDICCGKLGIPAYQQARAAYPAVRAWRTSHFGGHRYAPTAWEFPSGYMWAFLDDPAVTSVLQRDVHPSRLSDRVRGWTGAAAQVAPLDREGLHRWGWQWLHFPRRGEVLHHDSGERTWDTRLQYRTPEGRAAAYRGTVQVGRDIPVHGCGPRWDELDTTVPEYTLRSLVEEHPVST